MLQLWLKALHIISIVTWFAGLFYGPRLFVYHALNTHEHVQAQLCIMERKLYYIITWPSAVAASGSGLGLLAIKWSIHQVSPWIIPKLFAVALLWAFHLSIGYFLKRFASQSNTLNHRFYRYYNEVPSVLLVIVILIVVFKLQH